jgi:SAM-dependent methyltransferase
MTGDAPGARISAWQNPEVARRFVEGTRDAIPYGADQLAVMLLLIRRFCPQPRLLLDLGCGDGTLARLALEAAPGARAVLLDHSEPMVERAREALASYGDRCEIRLADLSFSVAGFAPAGSVDLVLSGYAIHHLPDVRKRTLYAEIHDLLAPGGLFVNVEHVASATPALEALHDDLFIDHLTARDSRPREEIAAAYHARPDRADNRLAPVETQLTWLREIGFDHVDCAFKWFELAVFSGVKRAPSVSSDPAGGKIEPGQGSKGA